MIKQIYGFCVNKIFLIVLVGFCAGGVYGEKPGERSVSVLIKEIDAAQSDKEKTKAAVALSKVMPQDKEELLLVLDLVRRESDDIDFWALKTIRISKNPEFIPVFRKCLKDADKKIRLYSAMMLGRLRYTKAEKEIIGLLKKEPELMYAQALARMNSRQGLLYLTELLQKGNDLAVEGLVAYGADGLSAAAGVLEKAEPKNARYVLCLAVIENTRDPNAVAKLRELLGHTRNDAARKAAAALASIKNPGSVDVYLMMISHQDDEIRKIGENIVRNIDDKTFEERLISLIESPDPVIRKNAARAGGIKSLKKAVPLLKKRLSDENQEAALESAKALTKITGKTYAITPKSEE